MSEETDNGESGGLTSWWDGLVDAGRRVIDTGGEYVSETLLPEYLDRGGGSTAGNREAFQPQQWWRAYPELEEEQSSTAYDERFADGVTLSPMVLAAAAVVAVGTVVWLSR